MSWGVDESGVLLVDLAAGYGGAETRVVDTARGLRHRGFRVRVVCLGGAPLDLELTRAGVPALRVASSKWDPRLVTGLRRLLRRHAGWVVDCHNAQSQLAVQLASWGRSPDVTCIATVHSEYRRSERSPLGMSLHEAVLSRTIRRGWPLVAVSTSVADSLDALDAAGTDVSVVWSGIDPPDADRSDAARAAVRRELSLHDDDFVVVVVGRLVPVKNVAMAVRAVARLQRLLPRARLLVVGDGPERVRLEALAREQHRPAGTFRFVGHRKDVARLLAASDVLAITSTTEGMPYVLLEAAATGTPLVSTRVGAIPEVFDGAVALLPAGVETLPDGDRVLADALLRLALDPHERALLARRAADVQRRQLSAEAMLDATLAVYHQHAGPRPATAGSPR